MRLEELLKFHSVTIQCHDNPDADTIASGYGLYCYFKSKEKNTRLIYSGRNEMQKSNLRLMTEKLHIPLEYISPPETETFHADELLLTVDCQYGAGNVTKLKADYIAIIDHHQIEITDIELSHIIPGVGSCSTIVWKMLTRLNRKTLYK